MLGLFLGPKFSYIIIKVLKQTENISFVTFSWVYISWWMDFENKIYRNVPLVTLYQNCQNGSAPLNKMAARLKNRKKHNMTSPPRPLTQFQNNFTGMFLGWPSTKIAQTVLLGWTRWPPELKLEKTLNISSVNHLLKRHLLLNQWMDFGIIFRNVPWGTLFQNCLNSPAPLKKWPPGLKIKNIKRTSPARALTQFQNNYTGIFLRWPSTKIAQTVLLGWTRWPPELKKKKKKKKNNFKRLLVCQPFT